MTGPVQPLATLQMHGTSFDKCKGEGEVSSECVEASGKSVKITGESQATAEAEKLITGRRRPEKLQ